MAGTPTTNYNIPTYADTDAPDLSGAYNDAMGIIDTQLKANADAIESASTGNYTGTAPINVDNEGRTISVANASINPSTHDHIDAGVCKVTGNASAFNSGNDPNEVVVPNRRALVDYVAAHGGTAYTAGAGISINGTTISAKGALSINNNNIASIEATGVPTGSAGTVAASCTDARIIDRLVAVNDEEHKWPGGAVPTVAVLKQYVESKMAAAGAAYTGTAPVVVDNESHTISVNASTPTSDGTTGALGVVSAVGQFSLINSDQRLDSSYVPNLRAVYDFVTRRTPDASTSVKGLVQLASGSNVTEASTALTPYACQVYIQTIRNNRANQAVDVQSLAGKLFVDPTTGLVFYKAPTE